MHKNKKAFTLIELLVVVLIIGILSAIALPQYQRAVEKSRLAEGLIQAKNIQNIFDLYLLQTGGSGESVDLMDLGANPTNLKYFSVMTNTCGGDLCFAEVVRQQNSEYLYGLRIGRNFSSQSWDKKCYTWKKDMGRYICHSLEADGWTYVDDSI